MPVPLLHNEAGSPIVCASTEGKIMNDVLDSVWLWIEAAIQNAALLMDGLLEPLHFLGPEMIILMLAVICVLFTHFFKKHYNTRRYTRLKKNFDHWFQLRQEAMNHADRIKGRAIAKNIDQAELNRAYYDFFFEGLLKSLLTTWLPIFCTLAYVNRSFSADLLSRAFNRPALFMVDGSPLLPWPIPSTFWFFISIILAFLLIPCLNWLKKKIVS